MKEDMKTALFRLFLKSGVYDEIEMCGALISGESSLMDVF